MKSLWAPTVAGFSTPDRPYAASSATLLTIKPKNEQPSSAGAVDPLSTRAENATTPANAPYVIKMVTSSSTAQTPMHIGRAAEGERKRKTVQNHLEPHQQRDDRQLPALTTNDSEYTFLIARST